jgi:hypothetical protein
MDYDKIIDSTYNWLSLEKLVWFMLFFWLSLPVLFLIPTALELGFFYYKLNWVVQSLYIITYLAVLLGFMILTITCLNHKKIKSIELTATRYIDTLFLIVLELWYVFFWNIHKSYRFTQLLLLVGIFLLSYYESISTSIFGSLALIVFLIFYVLMIVHNCIRLSFSLMVFYSRPISLKGAIKESWHMTHKKFKSTLLAYLFVVAAVFALFVVVSVILWLLSYFLLINYFTVALSQRLASSFSSLFAIVPALIAYYLGFIEIFSQLNRHHVTNNRIKRVLARKILVPKKKSTKKKIVKKKKVSKKTIKKKTTKKKTVKKKNIKKK